MAGPWVLSLMWIGAPLILFRTPKGGELAGSRVIGIKSKELGISILLPLSKQLYDNVTMSY